jgi:hypothetical protein
MQALRGRVDIAPTYSLALYGGERSASRTGRAIHREIPPVPIG